MSLNMSIRIIIKVFLALQLLLLIFRQMIDFAGIQWLMIIVNAVAIIVTITAFFGHLRLYAAFQGFLILYNVFVILIYGRFIQLGGGYSSAVIGGHEDFVSASADHQGGSIIRPLNSQDKTFYTTTTATDYHNQHPSVLVTGHNSAGQLPSTALLSFDANSRSFWQVIVSNHISELHSSLQLIPAAHVQLHHQQQHQASASDQSSRSSHHQPSLVDESLVDLCVQYIEIAIAALHIFFSLLGIGLILLKYKLQRDKLFRSNDKTTPPLPPYTISPQMNHYMSYTPTHPFNPPSSTKGGGSLYNSNSSSMRRSKRHRRSTRSLHNAKSKANSMGALNHIRSAGSTGSLRSMSKQSKQRKSATSLLMNDTSFISNNSNTIGSRGRSSKGNGAVQPYSSMPPPPPPDRNGGGYGTSRSSHYGVLSTSSASQQHAAKFLTSDSETDYYHTFTPNYVNNGLNNPLYGSSSNHHNNHHHRHSYLNDSETAI
ncbi:hypothetical protein TYRP_019233 [Tyrophagus putrescentiae]|nr:hypothetical protein TYRP_019233 [Tyrophagus putrescentiae]